MMGRHQNLKHSVTDQVLLLQNISARMLLYEINVNKDKYLI